jgi:hypothetical protein
MLVAQSRKAAKRPAALSPLAETFDRADLSYFICVFASLREKSFLLATR